MEIKISKNSSSSTFLGSAANSSIVTAFPKMFSIIPNVASREFLSSCDSGLQDQESQKDIKVTKCGVIVSSSLQRLVKIASTTPFFAHAIWPMYVS